MASRIHDWLQVGSIITVQQLGETYHMKVKDITPDGWVRGFRLLYDSGNLWRLTKHDLMVRLEHVGVVTLRHDVKLEE